MKKIAIFASGNGANAENICTYFNDNKNVCVVLLATNKRMLLLWKDSKNLMSLFFVSARWN